jgi:hypothetical protein
VFILQSGKGGKKGTVNLLGICIVFLFNRQPILFMKAFNFSELYRNKAIAVQIRIHYTKAVKVSLRGRNFYQSYLKSFR